MCSKNDSMKMERIQETALRMITLDFKSKYCELMKKCNKRSLYETSTNKIVELVYNVINGKSPDYLRCIVTPKVIDKDFRSNNKLVTPKFKTIKFGKTSITYTAAKLWNLITDDVKNANTMNTFRTNLAKFKWNDCMCGYCVLCFISQR